MSVEPGTIEFLNDVTLPLSVEFSRTEVTIRRMLELKVGSVVGTQKFPNEPFDIRVNGRLIARGEIVVVNDHYGIRITEVVSPDP